MKCRHIDLHSEYKKKRDTAKGKEKASSSSRQLTAYKKQKWDINDPCAHRIHTRIGDMTTLDYKPFSIVDNVGFICLLCSLEPSLFETIDLLIVISII